MSKNDATNRKDSKDKHITCKQPSAEAEAEEENKDQSESLPDDGNNFVQVEADSYELSVDRPSQKPSQLIGYPGQQGRD